jgi:hypothetical protein
MVDTGVLLTTQYLGLIDPEFCIPIGAKSGHIQLQFNPG